MKASGICFFYGAVSGKKFRCSQGGCALCGSADAMPLSAKEHRTLPDLKMPLLRSARAFRAGWTGTRKRGRGGCARRPLRQHFFFAKRCAILQNKRVCGSVPCKQNGGKCYGSIQGLLYRFPLSCGHQPAGQAAPRVHCRRDQGY